MTTTQSTASSQSSQVRANGASASILSKSNELATWLNITNTHGSTTTATSLGLAESYLHPVARIGLGAYGFVIAALDTRHTSDSESAPNSGRIALKRMTNALAVPIAAERVLREVRVLRELCERSFVHPNILRITDVLRSHAPDCPSLRTADYLSLYRPVSSPDCCLWRDVVLVTELLQTDLHRVISSKQPLSLEHLAYASRRPLL